MSVNSYDQLLRHLGHEVSVTRYEEENVAIECFTCYEVLIDFDRESD